MRSEDGFIAASVRSEGCVQVAENDNDVMSCKGSNEVCEGVVEVCEGVVELVFVCMDVAVGGCIAGDHLQMAMAVLEGGS